VALLAQLHGVTCVPHAWSSDILLAATLHFNAAISNGGVFVEFCVSENPLRKDLVREPFTIENGYLSVPETPGLGVELNEKTVKKFKDR